MIKLFSRDALVRVTATAVGRTPVVILVRVKGKVR